MSKPMKAIGIRFDEYFYELLKENANAKGMKLSRYIRTLLERALAVEGLTSHPAMKGLSFSQNDPYLAMIAELNAETLMTLRSLHSRYFESEEEFKKSTSKIYGQSLKMLDEMKKARAIND